jgi:acyl CoA:acetate/3-ketoacid CoA transferase alpha subunit
MDKTINDLAAAVADIEDGMTIMIGGFGGAGSPVELIHALIHRLVKSTRRMVGCCGLWAPLGWPRRELTCLEMHVAAG